MTFKGYSLKKATVILRRLGGTSPTVRVMNRNDLQYFGINTIPNSEFENDNYQADGAINDNREPSLERYQTEKNEKD